MAVPEKYIISVAPFVASKSTAKKKSTKKTTPKRIGVKKRTTTTTTKRVVAKRKAPTTTTRKRVVAKKKASVKHVATRSTKISDNSSLATRLQNVIFTAYNKRTDESIILSPKKIKK